MLKVSGSGAMDAPVWCVGEAPGEREEQEGRPFVGPSGYLLRKTLRQEGIKDEQVRFENLYQYKPPRNSFAWVEAVEHLNSIIPYGNSASVSSITLLTLLSCLARIRSSTLQSGPILVSGADIPSGVRI